MASAGYAVYGLPWTRSNGNCFWDGAFVHNTPLKAVTMASKPVKMVYATDVFPSKQEKLPTSMPETYHRIRDLLFTDRSIQQTKRYLTIDCYEVAKRVSAKTGVPVIPPLTYGCSQSHGDFPRTLSIRPETMIRMIRDIVE